MLTEAALPSELTQDSPRAYFYLLADKQTCSLFLKVSIRTQTKPSTPGEHDAQLSFPKSGQAQDQEELFSVGLAATPH